MSTERCCYRCNHAARRAGLEQAAKVSWTRHTRTCTRPAAARLTASWVKPPTDVVTLQNREKAAAQKRRRWGTASSTSGVLAALSR
eukprot:scaffold7_cov378-Prasinococcus_capsulatus_cf.AAC.5